MHFSVRTVRNNTDRRLNVHVNRELIRISFPAIKTPMIFGDNLNPIRRMTILNIAPNDRHTPLPTPLEKLFFTVEIIAYIIKSGYSGPFSLSQGFLTYRNRFFLLYKIGLVKECY